QSQSHHVDRHRHARKDRRSGARHPHHEDSGRSRILARRPPIRLRGRPSLRRRDRMSAPKKKTALAPILEAAGMIALLVAANFLFFKKNPGYVDLSPHPTL